MFLCYYAQQFPSRTISQDAKDVIKQMLTMDAYKRITAGQALKHPWIRQREYVAPKVHLNETVANLKKFNARRKFKVSALGKINIVSGPTRSLSSLFPTVVNIAKRSVPYWLEKNPSRPLCNSFVKL